MPKHPMFDDYHLIFGNVLIMHPYSMFGPADEAYHASNGKQLRVGQLFFEDPQSYDEGNFEERWGSYNSPNHDKVIGRKCFQHKRSNKDSQYNNKNGTAYESPTTARIVEVLVKSSDLALN
jgi:hypothetical protein